MKDYKKEIAGKIAALESIKEAGLDEQGICTIIEEPQDPGLGDYAFPCFRLAKALKMAPPEIAANLHEEWVALPPESDAAGTQPAFQNAVGGACRATGPYLNFFIDRAEYASDVVGDVLTKGERFGSSGLGGGRRVLVEYSSPNIAKPFHIGHIRSTVIGSAIGNIMSFLGYEVLRLNHLGDYGTQFGKLIVAYRRFGSREEVEASPIKALLAYYVKFHELAVEDPSLEDDARAAFAALEQGGAEELALWEWFREESLKEFTVVYEMMGIHFDSFDGESFFSDKMERVTDELERGGLLEESDGAQIVDLSEFNLGKALIKKRDGSTLYITRDIAAAIYRKEYYDFYKNIYVVASQQDLHFKQWIKILDMMGYPWSGDCVHIPFGLVHMAAVGGDAENRKEEGSGGKGADAEKGVMSTRTGNVVFLEDVLRQAIDKTKEIIEEKGMATGNADEAARQIGIGAVIFQELHSNRIKDYEFNWNKVLNFDGETGPYVQYGHARAASVLRRAEEMGIGAYTALAFDRGQDAGSVDWSALKSDSAFALLRLIGAMPGVIEEAGEKFEPSLITRHVTDIAQAFSVFYHDEHILSDEGAARTAKLGLTAATKQAIKNGLALLGISAPERM